MAARRPRLPHTFARKPSLRTENLIGCPGPKRCLQPKAADARPRLSGKTAEMNNGDGTAVTVGSHTLSVEICFSRRRERARYFQLHLLGLSNARNISSPRLLPLACLWTISFMPTLSHRGDTLPPLVMGAAS